MNADLDDPPTVAGFLLANVAVRATARLKDQPPRPYEPASPVRLHLVGR